MQLNHFFQRLCLQRAWKLDRYEKPLEHSIATAIHHKNKNIIITAILYKL